MKLHKTKPFLNPEKYIQKAVDEGFKELRNFEPDSKIYVCNSLLDEMDEIVSDEKALKKLEGNMVKIGVPERKCRIYATEESILFAMFEPAKLKENIAALNLCSFMPDGTLFLGWQALRRKDNWLILDKVSSKKAARYIEKYYPGKIDEYLKQYTRQTVQQVLFLEFVDVQLKTVSHNRKYKPKRDRGVKNKTHDDIIVADINWHKDVERNTPFAVRGHWRMQRCGPGLNKVKLIWIKPHQRSGYHRDAGKKNLNE
jgi:hypothetical protein